MEVNAGSHSYHSKEPTQPLSPLEEAVLIAAVGVTGQCQEIRIVTQRT